MKAVEVKLDSPNGPLVIVHGDKEPEEILRALPKGWTIHDDDWQNQVVHDDGSYSYPLSAHKGPRVRCVTVGCKGDASAAGSATGLCSRCYQRRRRGVKPSATPLRSADGEGDQILVRLPKALAKQVRRSAKLSKLSPGAWIRSLIVSTFEAR